METRREKPVNVLKNSLSVATDEYGFGSLEAGIFRYGLIEFADMVTVTANGSQ